MSKNYYSQIFLHGILTSVAVLLAITPAFGQHVFEIPLENPAFTKGVSAQGIPLGWSKYGGGKAQGLKVVDDGLGGKALQIADDDRAAELGVTQTVPLKGGQTYQASVKVGTVEGASAAGAYLQFRFLPSQQFVQQGLMPASGGGYSETTAIATAPPDTTKGVIYLYTHRAPTPKVLVADVRLWNGLPPPPPPPPPPEPPQYDKLKNPRLDIPLVASGLPSAAIVAPASGVYHAAAATIQKAIEARTGVRVPIVSDESQEAAVPIRGNLIVLGNRCTNKTIGSLYDLYYCVVDLKYPGPEGYAVRTVHNPFGDGHSVVVVGGSDATGVDAGAQALADVLAKAPAANGGLSIGWTMLTKLGKGITPPTNVREFQTWEASKGYGSVGYFGWCSLSKRMAMYYMTGDERNAREFVRLAFPDAQAIKEIEQIDGEQVENKHDPLAGFYHYNAHMAILFWDLIEESPVFTDAERLKITNAFARQLNHRKSEGVYGLTKPPAHVSSRHGQWAAISLYCLGRYFNKHYPHPVWAQCARAGALAFQSLDEHAWIAGESDNLFWYSTGIAPIFTYMTLTGDRKPLQSGVLRELLRGQEILASGRVPDWALRSAALDFLNKAAYLTGDGRWITYRERTQVDTSVFRLGQSFWPDETLQPKPPHDLAGKWSVQRLPLPAWGGRGSGLPLEQSFYFGSYRSTADATGDFILLDGFNGASRNPYHTFDILELRLDGRTLLQGYHNQVVVSADAMVEPAVAMDAALLHSDVVGATATAVGEVPRAAFCNWRRTLCQRTGRYALIVDDLAFRADSQNMKVTTTWQPVGGTWDEKRQAVRIPAGRFELRPCDVQDVRGGSVVTMSWNGAVTSGEHRIAFYLIAPTGEKPRASLACSRVAENAAALALPQPPRAVGGEHTKINAQRVVLPQHHLSGRALASAGIDSPFVSGDAPVDLDWDFASGVLNVVASKTTTLRLSLNEPDKLRVDGAAIHVRRADGLHCIALPEGRHVLTAASPGAEATAQLTRDLESLLADGARRRAQAVASAGSQAPSKAAAFPAEWTVQVGGKVADLVRIPAADGDQLCVAEGSAIHVLSLAGREIRKLQADGKIRVLHWWDDPKLLLAGCVDEKVIAFDASGRRKWVLTSVMDPAVYEAAKTYWFKSAPGHEGIHGLHTGVFDEGKNRCFVGSACTLEILDDAGQLVKRTPVFWGPAWKFLLVAARDGGKNLLIAQWPNGYDGLPIVSSKTLAVAGAGYAAVPSGHSHVSGWTAQNRTALVLADLNGDGKREVATAVNGTWNRVTIYSEEGQPLYNAQFGPGASSAPRAQLRDMDVADLDGDGKKELVTAVSEGLVVALGHQCQKLWSTRTSSPPLSLQCIQRPGERTSSIVVGCDDGTVALLDARGANCRLGKMTGRPTHIRTVQTPAGPLAVLATDRGELAGFRIAE